MTSKAEHWDATPGVLYDLDWRQCRSCLHWHQVTQEDLDGSADAIPDPEHPDTVMLTNEPGNTCPDCGGELGEWLPRNATGRDENGELTYE